MNAKARAFAMSRLIGAKDLPGLRAVWDTLGVDMQRDEQIRAMKDTLKDALRADDHPAG